MTAESTDCPTAASARCSSTRRTAADTSSGRRVRPSLPATTRVVSPSELAAVRYASSATT
eukprot:CAMPEP_0177788196 /NCGR_PEP_ID=MMETSP0491_2-20121128/21961_1 /TAXON_ID=63592 /ORGANISM="Tetraselmis chuii, Strain PLY429" /LENGTH=59 /DNA_ID=CAMNT_0019309725 /DNA_START=126 /DNA_END=301 /DNA_ORIENTATION=+